MVTVIEPRNDWGEAFENFGRGLSKGYMNRSDEMALQKSIEDLGENPSPQDILNAVTKTRTYNSEAKQNLFKNYLGAAEFAQKQSEAKEANDILKEQNRINALKVKADDEKKKQKIEDKAMQAESDREAVEAVYRLANPKATADEVKQNTAGLRKPSDLTPILSKPENVTEYQVAQNKAKTVEKQVNSIRDSGEASKKLIIPTETAIVNNEKYTTGQKFWDAAIGLADNSFLNLLKSQTAQQLEAYAPIAVQSFSAKMSGVLSVARQRLIEKKAVNPNKDKETNRMFLYLDLFDRRIDILTEKFTDELINENKYGLPPADLNKQLEKKLRPYKEQINNDIGLLLKGKKPTSPMSNIGVLEKKKAAAPKGTVLTFTSDGKEHYVQKDLIGKPGYEEYTPYEL